MASNINWFVLWMTSNQAMMREMEEKKRPTDDPKNGCGDGEMIENHHKKFEAGWKYPQLPFLSCNKPSLFFFMNNVHNPLLFAFYSLFFLFKSDFINLEI